MSYKVRNYIDSTALKKDVSYSLANLSEAMSDQASLLVHYGSIHAKAARQVDDVKLLLENTEAAVYRKIREDLEAKGEKVTEPMMEKLVTRHERVIAMKKALNEAKQIEAVAKIAVEGFRHRKDMIVQEGARERKEMEGEIAIRVRESRDQRYANTAEGILARRANA